MAKLHTGNDEPDVDEVSWYQIPGTREAVPPDVNRDRYSNIITVCTGTKASRRECIRYEEWAETTIGNKAVKHFTSRERGKCRFLYNRQTFFWDMIQKMIRN